MYAYKTKGVRKKVQRGVLTRRYQVEIKQWDMVTEVKRKCQKDQKKRRFVTKKQKKKKKDSDEDARRGLMIRGRETNWRVGDKERRRVGTNKGGQ